MGQLRTEPKAKSFLSDNEYTSYLDVLSEARTAAGEHHVFWDLEDGENAGKIRRAFMHIAEKEGIPVNIRRARGSRSLHFNFKDSADRVGSRMSAGECQKRIVGALTKANHPMQKSEIIDITGISPSTWNIRIKELVRAGLVVRSGDRRDTKYRLA